jgi:hypothetical protein
MNRKFIIIDEKSLECSVPVELNATQEAILECKELRDQIDQIAKNLQVCWDVKKIDNEMCAVISKVIEVSNLDENANKVETKAINFMSAIEELTLPAFDEPKCPCHEDAEVIAERLAFCKEVRADMDDVENIHVIGAKLIAGNEDIRPFVTDAGRIGATLLKELLDLYIEKYDHE